MLRATKGNLSSQWMALSAPYCRPTSCRQRTQNFITLQKIQCENHILGVLENLRRSCFHRPETVTGIFPAAYIWVWVRNLEMRNGGKDLWSAVECFQEWAGRSFSSIRKDIFVAFCNFCVEVGTIMIIWKSGNIHKRIVIKHKRRQWTEMYL
jgi:hypothetical protein